MDTKVDIKELFSRMGYVNKGTNKEGWTKMVRQGSTPVWISSTDEMRVGRIFEESVLLD